jgi:cellulose biosynthesis protein BcsQ
MFTKSQQGRRGGYWEFPLSGNCWEIISLLKGEDFDDWRILLTRVDNRKTTTNQAVMVSLAPWTKKIFKTTIPQSESLNQAQIARMDIFHFEPKNRGALAYEALAMEIMRYGR